jgi:fructooligosaccharide transport system permease protein
MNAIVVDDKKETRIETIKTGKWKTYLAGYSFITPALILIIIFGIIPLFLAIYISLYKFPLINPARREFIGLENYIRLFQDESLRKAFFNTLYYAALQMPIQTALGLLLAVLVQKPMKAMGFFRAGFYLPVVISMVVASTMWKVMLDSQNGIINSFLMWLGFSRQPFLTSVTQALPTLAVMLSWKWVGFSMIIFLAGLHSIPDSLYEAAELDGASGWQSFVYVTLPLLRTAAVYVIVTNTINAAKLFTPIYVITQGGPQESTSVVIYYIYREAFSFGRLGYGSAIAAVFTVFLVIFASFQLKMMRSTNTD